MKNNDSLFAARPLDISGAYIDGIYPAAITESDVFVKCDSVKAGKKRGIVLPLAHGNAYEVKFTAKPNVLKTALCPSDPREMKCGEAMAAPKVKSLPYFNDGEVNGSPNPDNVDFICVPSDNGQYLVILTDEEPDGITVNEYPILLGRDTDDCWFYCQDGGYAPDEEGGLYDFRQSSDELYEHIYDPLMNRHPDYITKQWIGLDNSGKYDMYAYIFTPESYEQTIFITGGLHGDEIDGYLGLARFLEIMSDTADMSGNEGLIYLRHKVRLVVVPIVNVWSSHLEKNIRHNSSGVDLNRDFEAHTQAETVNVIRLLHRYKNDTAVLLDFHCSGANTTGLYYQFSIQAANSDVCRKVVNHIHERMKQKGMDTDAPIPDLHLIPGAYNKSSVYLQGYAYNHFGIPTLVVEHNQSRWYKAHSAESLSHAVECYGNQLIQTALAKLK